MKSFLISLALLIFLPSAQPVVESPGIEIKPNPDGNLFIITIDGFRWQELFKGADEELINDSEYTRDIETMKSLYWSDNETVRRQKLMPFFWSVISSKGQLYGNRTHDNKVNTSNIYSVSYPGYNEIFTGNTDLLVSSNSKKVNGNQNVLAYLNAKEKFKGKVVAFTSWDVFPFILNESEGGFMVNSGYEDRMDSSSEVQQMINRVQDAGIFNKTGTRYDQLTFLHATEYLQRYRPKVVYLGFGETDEYAHHGRYDLYLQQANKIDRMIAELWHWIQSTPGYMNNSTLIITTDHGRGSKDSKWTSHSAFIKGSSQTWLAMLGTGVAPGGEIKIDQQLYQRQFAGMMAGVLGVERMK